MTTAQHGNVDASALTRTIPCGVLDTARSLHRRGFAVIPLPTRSKRAVLMRWQHLRIREAELPEYFRNPEGNIGILLGEPSGGLVDIDLDHPLAVELAGKYLPPTQAVFGRAGKRQSHWLYRVKDPPPPLKRSLAPQPGKRSGQTVIEVRSTGNQTVAPGSVHPSGERVEWDTDGEPAEVDARVLTASAMALFREVQRRLGDVPRKQRRWSVDIRTY